MGRHEEPATLEAGADRISERELLLRHLFPFNTRWYLHQFLK